MHTVQTDYGSAYLQARESALRIGPRPYAFKQTQAMGLAHADVVLLPRDPWMRGSAVCSIEGDLWTKLFHKGGAWHATRDQRGSRHRLQIVCHADQTERAATLLRHAWEGPSDDEIAATEAALGPGRSSSGDGPGSAGSPAVAPWRSWRDLLRLKDAAGEALRLDEVVDIVPLDGATTAGEFTITETGPDSYRVEHASGSEEIDAAAILGDDTAASFPFAVPHPDIPVAGGGMHLHTLGCYSGTDPAGPTSCFRVILADRQLILDAMSGFHRVAREIPALDAHAGYLLSHTHEDHFHGLLETLARHGAATVTAAPEVIAGFTAIAGAILDRAPGDILDALDYTPIRPGHPLAGAGTTIDAAWMPGPVPTTAFRIDGGSGSLVYSADTLSRGPMQSFGISADEIEPVLDFLFSADLAVLDCGGADGSSVHGVPADWLDESGRRGKRFVGFHTSNPLDGVDLLHPGRCCEVSG